jgi:rhamnogalacturonyl hydrolase YesR
MKEIIIDTLMSVRVNAGLFRNILERAQKKRNSSSSAMISY